MVQSGVTVGGVLPAENVRVAGVQINLVPLHIVVELLCSKDFGNPHQLVVVIVTVEERLLAKYLHTTERLVHKINIYTKKFNLGRKQSSNKEAI